jgi:hypothetical protein
VSKSFYKQIDQNRPKNPKTDFFSIFVYHVFWRFSVRGVPDKNTTQKYIGEKNNLTLVLFGPLTHRPTTGVIDFFGRPLARQFDFPAGRRSVILGGTAAPGACWSGSS